MLGSDKMSRKIIGIGLFLLLIAGTIAMMFSHSIGGTFYTAQQESSYILSTENVAGTTYYDRQNGTTGVLEDSSINASKVLGFAVANLSSTGGLITMKNGNFTFDTPIVYSYGAKSITIKGANGWSKSYSPTGTFLKSTITNGALFKTTPQTNLRSAFGLKFEDLTVLGPRTATSTGFLLTNIDTFEFSSCSVLGFGVSLNVTYQGTTVAEQSGMGFIHECIFGEGATSTSEFLTFDKTTEVTISNNNFGWGNFTRAIHIKDSDKIRIGPDNEFNMPQTPSTLTEHIYIEGVYATPSVPNFVPNQIDIHNNWAYCAGSTNKWIRIVNSSSIGVWGVKSKDNTIQHGYSPSYFTHSPYAVASWTNLVAQDITYPPCQPTENLRDLTGTCPAGTTYQNKWSSVSLYFLLNIPTSSSVTIKLSKDGTSWSSVYVNNAFVNNTSTTLDVPTLWYWRVELTGTATLYGLWGTYGQ